MFVVRRSNWGWPAALLLGVALLVALPGGAQASPAEIHHVDTPLKVGFASSGVTVTQFEAGWTVPELDCQATPNGELSILISMQGPQQPVISIGMTGYCVEGTSVYAGWYKIPGRAREDCPGGPPVPGDQILAQMDAIGTIDLSMSACASISTDQFADQLTSASVIVRATRLGSGQPIQPLADFGSVYVTAAQVNDVSIAAGDSVNWRMVRADGTVRAVTSGLHEDGSFAVNWRAAR